MDQMHKSAQEADAQMARARTDERKYRIAQYVDHCITDRVSVMMNGLRK